MEAAFRNISRKRIFFRNSGIPIYTAWLTLPALQRRVSPEAIE
jgi:hypothetical protein